MLYAFGFDRVGVLVSDMYIVIPSPRPGQEGAERGVRLEVRLLERGELPGSIYSARPIEVARPVWRADLLEAVDGPPGSLNRAHHHPVFRGWEPGSRVFDADPVEPERIEHGASSDRLAHSAHGPISGRASPRSSYG